jgi:1-acyl-sn-glycerol-3-phosphate acyltransferase
MLTFSYSTGRRILKIAPLCPKPKAISLKNIPKEVPIIYAHNHITRRTENLFLAMAAPSKPNIVFLADITLMDPKYLPILKKDIRDSTFPLRSQKKAEKSRFRKMFQTKFVDFFASFLNAQLSRFGFIKLNLYEPTTDEEKHEKHAVNKKALEKCIECLESNIPLAIAPSGGKTSETTEEVHNTVIPTLASWLYKRGKVVKIIPSVVKEKPLVNKSTYWRKYVADRIFIYKFYRWILRILKIKGYKKPRLTVEFLPPITFEKESPTKSEKVEFVKDLQQMIYSKLKQD